MSEGRKFRNVVLEMKKLGGKWKRMALYYVSHPAELSNLVNEVKNFASRDGLRQVKEDFNDMYWYVRDVSTGRYKGYNATSLVLVVAALIYLVTPADMIPDIFPAVGLVDDVSVFAWAAKQVVDEIDKYKKFAADKFVKLPDKV